MKAPNDSFRHESRPALNGANRVGGDCVAILANDRNESEGKWVAAASERLSRTPAMHRAEPSKTLKTNPSRGQSAVGTPINHSSKTKYPTRLDG